MSVRVHKLKAAGHAYIVFNHDFYGGKKKSSGRERSVLNIIGEELGTMFVREVEGQVVDRWYQSLTAKRGSLPARACGTSTSCTAPADLTRTLGCDAAG